MKIILNNKVEVFNSELLTIRELLQLKKYTFKMLVIKINGTLVKKNDYDITTVKEGDDVMVLHLISGG